MTMPLEIITLPCLSDNYAFLLHNDDTGQTALVDAPEEAAIKAELDKRGWGLDLILLTHHHWDHVDGVDALRAAFGAKVVGASADAHRLPDLDLSVNEGDRFDCLGAEVEVLDVSGHTVGHIAFRDHIRERVLQVGLYRAFQRAGTEDRIIAFVSQIHRFAPKLFIR